MLFSQSFLHQLGLPPLSQQLPPDHPLLLRQSAYRFPPPLAGHHNLSPGSSDGWSGSSGRAKSPPSSGSPSSPTSAKSPKFFRPWELDEQRSHKDSSPQLPPSPPVDAKPLHSLLEGKPRRGRVSGSRNERVVAVEPTPLLKQQSALEAIATNLGKSGLGHRCIYCGKIYSRKYGLKIHLRTHTGFKPLKCRICDRAFGDPSNLNKHTRLHAENGMGFHCQPCDKLLLRPRDLEKHLNARHSLPPQSPVPPFVRPQHLATL